MPQKSSSWYKCMQSIPDPSMAYLVNKCLQVALIHKGKSSHHISQCHHATNKRQYKQQRPQFSPAAWLHVLRTTSSIPEANAGETLTLRTLRKGTQRKSYLYFEVWPPFGTLARMMCLCISPCTQSRVKLVSVWLKNEGLKCMLIFGNQLLLGLSCKCDITQSLLLSLGKLKWMTS